MAQKYKTKGSLQNWFPKQEEVCNDLPGDLMGGPVEQDPCHRGWVFQVDPCCCRIPPAVHPVKTKIRFQQKNVNKMNIETSDP